MTIKWIKLRQGMLRSASALGLGLAIGLTAAGSAQAFPDKPITLLIPYPPGGSADLLARPIAAQMQKTIKQPVVLEYRPGAGGTIATAQLARAKPDGYTVLMVLAAHAINPSMYKSLPYDTEKDFAPVSVLATLPMLVAAAKQTPVNTTQELIDYARANPDKLTFASAGNGNTSHLAAELFKSATHTKMIHVPYKGSGPAVVAMLSGEVSLMFDSISTSLPHVKAGKLKGIAVTGSKRSAVLPDVPTVAESGVPGFEVNGWYGILAPAGTPDSVIRDLNKAFNDAARTPAVSKQLTQYGYEIEGSTPEAFSSLIATEIKKWKTAVDQSGARIE